MDNVDELAAEEVLLQVRSARDELRAVLPALVVASRRYEDGDGILTDPVNEVAEAVGRLEVALGLMPEDESPPGD